MPNKTNKPVSLRVGRNLFDHMKWKYGTGEASRGEPAARITAAEDPNGRMQGGDAERRTDAGSRSAHQALPSYREVAATMNGPGAALQRRTTASATNPSDLAASGAGGRAGVAPPRLPSGAANAGAARMQPIQWSALGRAVARTGAKHAVAHEALGGHHDEHGEAGESAARESPDPAVRFGSDSSYVAEQLRSGRWMDRYPRALPDVDEEIRAAAQRPPPTASGMDPMPLERQAEFIRREGQRASNRPWAPIFYGADRDRGANLWDSVESIPEDARALADAGRGAADAGRRALESVNVTPRWARREMERQAIERARTGEPFNPLDDATEAEEIVVTGQRLDPITRGLRSREEAEERGRNIGLAVHDFILGPWDMSRDAAEAQARARLAGDRDAARRARLAQRNGAVLSGMSLAAPLEIGKDAVRVVRHVPRGAVEDATLARLRAEAIGEAMPAASRNRGGKRR